MKRVVKWSQVEFGSRHALSELDIFIAEAITITSWNEMNYCSALEAHD